jgi:putative endonuclease
MSGGGGYLDILGSHTGTLYLGVTSNLYLRVLYFEGPETFAQPSPQGWRREKKLNLIRTIDPKFKELAQTRGWKMITVHEKDVPVTIKCVP